MRLVDKSLLKRAHDHAIEFLEALPERHVGARASRDELLHALAGPLSRQGEDPSSVIDLLASQAPRGTTASAGSRYFGFVIGGSLPVALATDWLTSAWDQNTGIFATSPMASVAEEVAAGWLLDLFALPREASVGFVTGCQMANFTCLAAARHAVLRDAGWDVEANGLNGSPVITLIVSEEAHITILTSFRMLGLGNASLRRVETDSQGRMNTGSLKRMLEGVSGPAIVAAQAGNVNTGSFDPIREIASLTQERKAWLHIDGAFGLWARATPGKSELADGIELADSWATDAHKWLNVPYDCGISMVRDSAAHRASMTLTAAYLEQTQGSERDAIDWAPEFSRRGRGFTVYAALRTLGREGVSQMIDRSCDRASEMAQLLASDPRAEILNEVLLNQVLVRFHPFAGSPSSTSDDFTRTVISRVQKDGTCWLAGTTWHGLAAMRISFSSWATTGEDVTRSAATILRCLDHD